MSKRIASVGEEEAIPEPNADDDDRSRARALEVHCRQRERLTELGTIAMKIVHDLGGPLTVISALTERLLGIAEKKPGTSVGVLLPELGDIHVAAERMRNMLHGCLQITRERTTHFRDIDVDDLLEAVVADWRAEAGRRGISMSLDVDTPLVCRADTGRLRRVVDNLVQNALEAIETGPGHVDIRGMRDSRGVVITVGDTGPGVAEGIDLYGLFETTKEQGTGLGLAIAKEFVMEHKGTIRHAHRRPHGTVFTIELFADLVDYIDPTSGVRVTP